MNYQDTYPQEYKNKPFPNRIPDPWFMYIRQCTSYCAHKLSKLGYDIGTIRRNKNLKTYLKSWNANLWDDRARELGVKINKTPKAGSIAQWETTHVAYVEKIYANGTIDITEYNWGTPGKFGQRNIKASTVSNFIHFTEFGQTTNPDEPAVPAANATKYEVLITAKLGLKVRNAPSTSANMATNTGTDIDGILAYGDRVSNCTLAKGDTVDGYNGWYCSQKGRYFSSRYTDKPANV